MIHILDLFCGAGGAAQGYHQALEQANIPHTITGVDHTPQPNYPFHFVQADAMTYSLAGYDFIHASPPCQLYSVSTRRVTYNNYTDLLPDTRRRLTAHGTLYVIENVTGAPMRFNRCVRLCGTHFGLNVLRHRWFEFPTIPLVPEPKCNHQGQVKNEHRYVTVAGHGGNGSNAYAVWCEAMQINWMSKTELAQAIPPAYTEYIMSHLIKKGHITHTSDVALTATELLNAE